MKRGGGRCEEECVKMEGTCKGCVQELVRSVKWDGKGVEREDKR